MIGVFPTAKRWLFWSWGLFLYLAVTASAEFRTFTNQDGNSIQARLVRIEGDLAVLQLEDQSIHRYPIQQLSEEDQKFVRREPILKALADERMVEIRTRRTRLNRSAERGRTLDHHRLRHERTEDTYALQILFNNRSSVTLEGFTIAYRIFTIEDMNHQRASGTAVSHGHQPMLPSRRVTTDGVLVPKPIPPRSEMSLETKSFLLVSTDRQELDQRPGQPIGSVIRVRRGDTLQGIWVRIMDGDKIVREVVQPQSLRNPQLWTTRELETLIQEEMP